MPVKLNFIFEKKIDIFSSSSEILLFYTFNISFQPGTLMKNRKFIKVQRSFGYLLHTYTYTKRREGRLIT